MFSLTKETLRLADVNPRKENHGDEKVLAVDLKLEFETANAVLLKFSPTLRDAFYTSDPNVTADMINPEHAPVLRNPQIGKISWALDMPSVRFSVFADGSNEEEIVFTEAKCNTFSFIFKEGGTVIVGFRIQASKLLENDVTKLLYLMEKTIKSSLIEQEEAEYTGDAPNTAETATGKEDLLTGAEQSSSEDSLFDEAVIYVRDSGNAKISALQRHLKVGYNRAARLLDEMEQKGIVSAMDGDMVRQVIAVAATPSQDEDTGSNDGSEQYDALYDKAKEFVSSLNKASLSIVKRKLKTETNVTQRILDQLVEDGVLAEANDQGMYDVQPVTA